MITNGLVPKLLGELTVSSVQLFKLDGSASAFFVANFDGSDAALSTVLDDAILDFGHGRSES